MAKILISSHVESTKLMHPMKTIDNTYVILKHRRSTGIISVDTGMP